MSAAAVKQRDEARAEANRVRSSHAALIARIRGEGKGRAERMAADVLETPGEYRDAGRLRLYRLLGAVPHYGRVRSGKVLQRVGVRPGQLEARLEDLRRHERERLANYLRMEARGWEARTDGAELRWRERKSR